MVGQGNKWLDVLKKHNINLVSKSLWEIPFKNQSIFFLLEAQCPLFSSNCAAEETTFLTEQQNLGGTENSLQ